MGQKGSSQENRRVKGMEGVDDLDGPAGCIICGEPRENVYWHPAVHLLQITLLGLMSRLTLMTLLCLLCLLPLLPLTTAEWATPCLLPRLRLLRLHCPRLFSPRHCAVAVGGALVLPLIGPFSSLWPSSENVQQLLQLAWPKVVP
jgi:hypothetical protein